MGNGNRSTRVPLDSADQTVRTWSTVASTGDLSVHEVTLGRSSLFASRHMHRHNWRASVPPVLKDLAVLDAVGQADLVRRARLQPLDLVDAAIDRIERLNPALNAVITKLYDKARALAVSGYLPDGPFRGVPLLLKDYSCYTDGDPYYEGTKFLRDWTGGQKAIVTSPGGSVPPGSSSLGKRTCPNSRAGPSPSRSRSGRPVILGTSAGRLGAPAVARLLP